MNQRIEHFAQMCVEGLTEFEWAEVPAEIREKFLDAGSAFIAWADEQEKVIPGTIVQELGDDA